MTPPDGSESTRPLPAAYILAGGRSRRFGRDKARFELNGKPLLRHAVDLLAPYAARVVAVARTAGCYEDLGVTTIGDIVHNAGPIGGLHAALRDAAPPSWFALIACDWFGAKAEWFERLLLADRAASHAVVYRGDRFEPTFALFHTTIGPLVDKQLVEGILDMQSLLKLADATVLPLPAGWKEAVNVNRQSDVADNG